MTTLLKKYKLVVDNEIHYLFPDEIKTIIPSIDKNGNAVIIVNYYDDEFCMNSTIICDKIEVENMIH